MKWNVGQIRSYPNRMLIPIFVKKSISSLILTSNSENSSLTEAITKMRDMIKAMEEELERFQDKEDE